MLQQSCEDTFVNDDVPLQEFWNSPSHMDALRDSWWKAEIGRDYITRELKDIYSGLFDHFSKPDAKAFVILYDRLASHIDAGLRTPEHRNRYDPSHVILHCDLQCT